MDLVKPNYKNGTIVNLVRSVYQKLGLEKNRSPALELGILKNEFLKNKIALIIIDGAGESYYEYHREVLGLDKWFFGELQAVYPSTTAASITSLLTGLTPMEHGIPGWHTYFRNVSSIVNILPFKNRFSLNDNSLEDSIPDDFITFSNESKELNKIMVSVQPDYLSDTIYSKHMASSALRYGYSNYNDFSNLMTTFITSRLTTRKFAYAYIPTIDSLSHKHGQNSSQVLAESKTIGRIIQELFILAEANNTSLIVTADHGFISNKPETTITTKQHPGLKQMLALPLCGEPRTAFAYVKPAERKNFCDYINTYLSNEITVRCSREMLKEGWFGTGSAHKDFENRIGDYTLCMNENFTIFDVLKNESQPKLKGVHGGWHKSEMNIPMFLTRS